MKSLATSQKKIPNEFFDEVVQKSTHMTDLWQLSASSSRDNLGVNMMDKACGDIVKYGREYGLVTHDQIFLAGEPDSTQLFCLADLGRSDIANVLQWKNETNVASDSEKIQPNVFRQPSAVFSISYKKENVLYKMFFCYVNDSTQQNTTDRYFTARNLWQQVDAMRQLTTEKMPVVTIRANFFEMKQIDGASDTDKIGHFLMDMYVQHLWTLFMALRMIRDQRGVFHTERDNIYDVHVFLGQYTLTCDDHLPKALIPEGYYKTDEATQFQKSSFYSTNFSHLEHCQYATHYGIVNVLKVERIDVAALIRTFSNEQSTSKQFQKINSGVCYLTDLLKLLKALHPKYLAKILQLSVDINSERDITTELSDLDDDGINWNEIMLSADYTNLSGQYGGKFIKFIHNFSCLLDLKMQYFTSKINFSTNKVEPLSRLIQKINYELRNKKLMFTGRQNLNPPVYPKSIKNMSLKTRLCTADYGKVELDSEFESFLNGFNIPFAPHFFRSIACTNQLACQELAQQMETNKKIEDRVYKHLTSYPLTAQTEILYFLKQVLKKNEVLIKGHKYEISAINEFSAFFEAVFWRSDLTPGQLLYTKIRAFERALLMKCFLQLYKSQTYPEITETWVQTCADTPNLIVPAYFLWKCMYVSLATNLSSDDYMVYYLDGNNGNNGNNGNDGRACIENAVVRQTQYQNRIFAGNPTPHDLPLQIEFIHDACRDTCVLQALASLLAAIEGRGHGDDFDNDQGNFGTIKMLCLIGFFQINFQSTDQFVQIMTIDDYGITNTSILDALQFDNLKQWVDRKLMHEHLYAIKIDRVMRTSYNPGEAYEEKYESLFGNQNIIETLFVKFTEVTSNGIRGNNNLDADVRTALEIFVRCCIVKIFSSGGSFLYDYLNLANFSANGRAVVSYDAVKIKIEEQIASKKVLNQPTRSYIVNFYIEAFRLLNVHIQGIENSPDKQDRLKLGNVILEEVQTNNQNSAIFAAVKNLPLIEAWPAGDLISYDPDDVSKIKEICEHTNKKRQMNTEEVVFKQSDSLLIDLQDRIRNKIKLTQPQQNHLANIDIVQFDAALIQKLDQLDSDIMNKHLEYMSSLTHTNFQNRFDVLGRNATDISVEIFALLQSAALTPVQTEESITPVQESAQHYEQRLWILIKESGRDKYEKMAECYFALAGCLNEQPPDQPPDQPRNSRSYLNYFAMFYFIDVAKLFCECFFESTSENNNEKRQILARARHAKVKFDSRNMLLPLLRIHVYRNTDASNFRELRNKVKKILRIALKWKILLVKSTLISTISNVLWNTPETVNVKTGVAEKRHEMDEHFKAIDSNIKGGNLQILKTRPYFDWTSFETYPMDRFGDARNEFIQLPVRAEDIHIQNVDNLFKQKVANN